MKIGTKILIFTVFAFLAASCSSQKKIKESRNLVNCLKLDPLNYHNVMFNPEWVAKNGVSTIIEREYLDGREGRLHLVTVLDYDSEGFLRTKYSGLSYPEDGSPNRDAIFSKWDYQSEKFDSFLIHTCKVIRFYNENGKMEETDTLAMGGQVYNLKSAKYFTNNNEQIRRYIYDNQGRLIKELDSDEIELYSIKYHNKSLTEITQFANWENKEFTSWVTADKNGRIISNYDESNLATHEFKYDQNGRMIEDKHWFKNEEPNFHTYEYVINNAR